MVSSRAFPLSLTDYKIMHQFPLKDSDEKDVGLAIYPLIDLVNYRPSPIDKAHNKIIVPKTGLDPGFYMKAETDFKAFTEITWSYN